MLSWPVRCRRRSKEKEDIRVGRKKKNKPLQGNIQHIYAYTFAIDGLSLGGGGAVRQAALAVGCHGVFDRY